MTKLNLDENSAQQVYRLDSFFIVIKYSRLLSFVITFVKIFMTFSLGYYLKHWIIAIRSLL